MDDAKDEIVAAIVAICLAGSHVNPQRKITDAGRIFARIKMVGDAGIEPATSPV
jgi:hypothetical protein